MKTLQYFFIPFIVVLLMHAVSIASAPKAGFFLPDTIQEMTLRYRMVKNLVVLPVTINDTVQVNLLLDTGCRNLILFGKRFKRLFPVNTGRPITFSGLGSGHPVTGMLTINNKVSIDEVLGEQIPIVTVDDRNVFSRYHNIDGVIGYDIFLRFEIELNPRTRTITFRPALTAEAPSGFAQVPLRIVDARPVLHSRLFTETGHDRPYDMMIDTGSSLGLLLHTTNISDFNTSVNEVVLGIGLSGPISGYKTVSRKLKLTGFEFNGVPTGIVSSQQRNSGSIGMSLLRDYIVILNYCKAYACFKRTVG